LWPPWSSRAPSADEERARKGRGKDPRVRRRDRGEPDNRRGSSESPPRQAGAPRTVRIGLSSKAGKAGAKKGPSAGPLRRQGVQGTRCILRAMAQAQMALGTLAETKVPRPPGRDPANIYRRLGDTSPSILRVVRFGLRGEIFGPAACADPEPSPGKAQTCRSAPKEKRRLHLESCKRRFGIWRQGAAKLINAPRSINS
jgi:hypothetical protein